jgi:hypothetical protein
MDNVVFGTAQLLASKRAQGSFFLVIFGPDNIVGTGEEFFYRGGFLEYTLLTRLVESNYVR